MDQLNVWQWGAVVIASLLLTTAQPTVAYTFGEVEINPRNMVAVAVPRTLGNYTLLVLEQRSGQRRCWQERGAAPTRIEPLLLKFNFAGICERATDSNGYSVRVGEQDLGLKYHLSLQKHKNELVLQATPTAARAGEPFEIGRTHGLHAGMLKIKLNSGWRLTKRTYQGKALGHYYFSRG